MPLDHFAFVLFKPKSPGNIGAAARALKNMGCRDLRIVQPAGFHIANAGERTRARQGPRSDDAKTMAVHGRDVLAAATIHPGLDSALADRTLVVGTTARAGLYRKEAQPVREASHELSALSGANRIALIFGPEDRGLTNEELKLCQRLITIPTAPEYPSLNLAQAVMIVAYELMLASGAARELPLPQQWARVPEVDAMLARMAQALIAIGFLPEDNPDHIMFALRTILGREGLRPRELDIMNGIASQILWFSKSGHDTLTRKRVSGKKLR
ncbi:MAG: RNA methyltransferase [Deltaproteobacteria bacterium]|nr:RNA methyltransferase [Deltaproteobacteria bacterium]MBV8454677.1 RNA methyltransferase [Deltaproteobacteria bacterium]